MKGELRGHFLTIISKYALPIYHNTPLLPRADSKGGVFDIRGLSANGGQPTVDSIVLDGMGEGDSLTVIDG